MKNIFLIVALVIFSSMENSFAQTWNTTGNAGTTPGTNFIGTTDAKDFVFKTNATEKGRVKSNGLWQFGATTNLAKIDSGGNLSFSGTAAYKVAANKYAFQYAGNPNYGLFFNAQSLLYEFRTSTALSVFSIGANSGNGIFKGNLKVGAYTLPATDGTSGQVLKTDGAGVLTWSADNAGVGSSQWTTNGANIYYNTGNVGIGITSPTSLLEISSAQPDAKIGITNSANFGRLLFAQSGTIFSSVQQIGSTYSTINRQNALEFMNLTASGPISYWTGGNERVRINSSGNVGIGTVTPGSRLHVVSTAQSVMTLDGGTGMYMGLYEGGTYRGYLGSYYSGNTADVDFGTGVGNTTGGVDLTIQGVPKLTVNADGNLTLGGSVNNSLTVAGTTSYLRMNASALTGTGWSYSNDGYYNYVNCIGTGGGIMANFANSTEPYQFTVWGNMQANGFISNSDRKLKTNIQSMEKVFSAIDVVKKLNPVSYDFKTDEYKIMNLPKTKQYGFIAQEMQEVLPNLVQSSNTVVAKDENGNLVRDQILSVNYLGVIPVLTEAIKEQQQTIETKTAELDAEKKLNADQQNQIESLNNRLDEMLNKMNNFETSLSQCCSNYQSTNVNGQSSMVNEFPKLEQNIPNPFMQSSYIKFYIPSSAKNSSITISDLNGRVMKTFSNLSVGFGTVNINGGELAAGTYQYTLFIDGNKIDTKEMILTK